MELDDLKTSWELLSRQLENQVRLNSKMIIQMTSHHYGTVVNRIVFPELIGGLGCLLMAIGLVWNFHELDSPLLELFGGLSLLFLLALCMVSFQSLKGLRSVDLHQSAYAETLHRFMARKIRFQKLQKLNIGLASLFVVAFIPVAVRLLDNKDITSTRMFWLAIVPICLVLQFLVSRWIFRHYNKTLKQAESILSDLEL